MTTGSAPSLVSTEAIVSALDLDFSEFARGWEEAYRISVQSSGPPQTKMALRRAGGLIETAYVSDAAGWVHEACVRQTSVTAEAWVRLASSGIIEEFWTMPEPERRMGLDGATWTLEGHRYGRTRVASQWGGSDEICRVADAFFEMIPSSAKQWEWIP